MEKLPPMPALPTAQHAPSAAAAPMLHCGQDQALYTAPWPAGAEVVLLLGPTGCGKTSALRQLFRAACAPSSPSAGAGSAGASGDNRGGREQDPLAEVQWDARKAVVSQFGSPERAKRWLSAVGLNSIPTWCKPYHVLSTGEAYRANLARRLQVRAEPTDGTACVRITCFRSYCSSSECCGRTAHPRHRPAHTRRAVCICNGGERGRRGGGGQRGGGGRRGGGRRASAKHTAAAGHSAGAAGVHSRRLCVEPRPAHCRLLRHQPRQAAAAAGGAAAQQGRRSRGRGRGRGAGRGQCGQCAAGSGGDQQP